MELNTILQQCVWSDAAARLNNNFQRIKIALVTSENNVSKNKGYFSTVEELIATHPDAVVGCIAYVGTTAPYSIYRWVIDPSTGIGSWVDTGETGGSEEIKTDEFVKSEQVEHPSVIVDSSALLVQLLQGEKILIPSTTMDAVVDPTTLKSLSILLSELKKSVDDEITRIDGKLKDLGEFHSVADFKSAISVTKTPGRYVGLVKLPVYSGLQTTYNQYPFSLYVSTVGLTCYQTLYMNCALEDLNGDVSYFNGSGEKHFTRAGASTFFPWTNEIHSISTTVTEITNTIGAWYEENGSISEEIGNHYDDEDNTGLWGQMRDVRKRLSDVEQGGDKVYLSKSEYQELVDSGKIDENVEYNIYEE